jgi:hypothetical protein
MGSVKNSTGSIVEEVRKATCNAGDPPRPQAAASLQTRTDGFRGERMYQAGRAQRGDEKRLLLIVANNRPAGVQDVLAPRLRVSMNSFPSGSMHIARWGGSPFSGSGSRVNCPPAATTSRPPAITSGT